MSRVILYHATLPGRLEAPDTAALRERLAYARRVTLAVRRADRELSLVGIALALAAAGALRGRAIAPEALRFPAGERPVFAQESGPVFSIAHSGRTVIAAASESGALGVDIERADESGLAASVRDEWSAREAVAKALGLGLRAAPEVQLHGAAASLRGRELTLHGLLLPGGRAWLAADFAPAQIEVCELDAVAELRRHAA